MIERSKKTKRMNVDKELKQIEIEGTNIILLEYSKKYCTKEIIETIKELQYMVGEEKQVIALPEDISLHTFDFQGFLDYLGQRFDVDIMYRKKK